MEKISYIMGGSSGMGLATAKMLVESGQSTRIYSHDVEGLARAEKTLAALNGGKVETRTLDLYDFDAVKSAISEIESDTRHIDQLVNAAGVFAPKAYLENAEADYDKYMDMNRSFFFLTQAVAKNMKENGGGSILNIGSMWAHQAIKATPSTAYSMAKAGLHSMTQHLAMELGENNIRVNAIAPSVVVTPIYGEFMEKDEIEGNLTNAFDEFHPIGRVGRVDDIANHAVFLLSEKAGWTTGAVHNVDGGVMAGRV